MTRDPITSEGASDNASETEPNFTPDARLPAAARGEAEVAEADPSAPANDMTLMRIPDAAKRSAATGRTVKLAPLDC